MRAGHYPSKCPSKDRCKHCTRAHYSFLHRDKAIFSRESESAPSTPSTSSSSPSVSAGEIVPSATVKSVQALQCAAINVLLPTALVEVRTAEGRTFKLRALLDQGSTFSFISESLCQLMGTKRHRTNLQVRCFGEKFSSIAKTCVNLTLAPCIWQGQTFPLKGYVYQRITSYAASRIRSIDQWPHLRDLPLADPDPSGNQPIHLLIGFDLYGALLLNDLRQGPLGTPTTQLTIFGWILSGLAGNAVPSADTASVHNCVSCHDTNVLLQRFWEDEGLLTSLPFTEEKDRCEQHFLSTYTRTPQGRFVVRLPFRSDPPHALGDTLPIASALYKKLESKLRRQPEIAQQYDSFMREYIFLGHMRLVPEEDKPRFSPVYIPHHAVLRLSSSSTKLRVVFNASCKSSNGTSLNEFLLICPKLQQDLPAILLRWRLFRYVYTADIMKIFRQILIHPDDADFQRILWSPDGQRVRLYQLFTVTYGLPSTPYLAMRVLCQLAEEEGQAFPSPVIFLRIRFTSMMSSSKRTKSIRCVKRVTSSSSS